MAKSSTRRVTIYINGKEVEASVKQIRAEMNRLVNERNLLLASERCIGNAQRRAGPPTNTSVSARTQTPPSRSELLQKKYYFCTVEQSRMNHDRTYHPVPYAPAPRLRDADGSLRPHTSGVRVCSCTSIATEPCRPTACAGEHPCCTFTHPATAHYSLLTANSSYTFSAKEKDPETGLSYFGSRYYSSDLSVWLSVDPMSDKYPYQSNYVYCSNNPLMIVDPNGMFETRAEAQKYRKEHHTGGSILLLASDDWTGFGIADDIFIPVVIVAGTAAYGGVVLFAHVRKKQSTGKSKRDRHDRQYNQVASIVRIIRIGERVPMKEKIKVK